MAHGDKYKADGKPVEGRKTFLRLMSYLACDKKLLSVIGFLIILSVVSGLLGSYMIRPIINDYIIPGDYSGLIKVLVLLAAIYLVGVVATYVQYILLNKIGQRTVTRMRTDLFQKMERLPIKYFDTHQHGDLMSRYTNDIDQVSNALTDSLSDMLSSALMLVGIFCLMIYISPILTLATLITVPLMFLSAKGIVSRSRKYFKAQQEVLGETNGYAEEMISGQKVIKVFGYEKKVEADFDELNERLREKSQKAQFYSGMMMPLMQNLNTLNYVIITIVGALLAIFRGFDVGGLAAFLQYSRQFGRPINELASLYNSIQAAIAGAERIFQIIDEEPELQDDVDAFALTHVKGDVKMTDVYFGYKPEKLILKGVSLHAKPGVKIALVGETGAGKTTILNMLPRFFDIKSGEITIDGHPIQKIKRESLRKSMAIVLQDTHLFTGTVCENIRLGRLDATDEEVVQAAKLTAAHSFIKRLPQGYNTLLENDGANLSQGQRQLLNIARAAVADPPILLLDEATSNIDTRSELLIQRGLDQLMEGRTSLIIAHRLSTVRNVDKILVLDHGQIIEQGSHQELIAQKGKYYSLYQEQFEEFG
ncbi:MAG: ABC transporter ATP-binding protein [Dysgonomonas sp.]